MADAIFDIESLTGAGVALQRYQPGEKIFVQGDDGDCLFVVRSGKVSIVASGTVLETIGPGGVFGEMALIDGEPRSATAVATEPTELAAAGKPAFLHLVRARPEFTLQIMALLAKRLRRLNDSL